MSSSPPPDPAIQIPHTVATDGQPFTAANIASTLLVLQLCLLSQPTGSLLYAKPNTRLGHVVFFFWRLNPLAAFAEAMAMSLMLAYMRATTRKARRNSPLFWHHVIGATLLLRSQSDGIRARTRKDSGGQKEDADKSVDGESISQLDMQTLRSQLGPRDRGSISFYTDIISLVAVSITAVKLCVVSVPRHVSVLLWLNILTFFSCHRLSISSRKINPDDLDPARLFQMVNHLDPRFTRRFNILSCLLFVLVPVYDISWMAQYPSPLRTQGVVRGMYAIMIFLWIRDPRGTEAKTWLYAKGLCRRARQRLRGQPSTVDVENLAATPTPATPGPWWKWGPKKNLAAYVLFVCLLVWSTFRFPGETNPVYGILLSLPEVGSRQNILMYYSTSYLAVGAMGAPLFANRKNLLLIIDLFLNIMLAQFVLAWILIDYNSTGTYRPTWLGWL